MGFGKRSRRHYNNIIPEPASDYNGDAWGGEDCKNDSKKKKNKKRK